MRSAVIVFILLLVSGCSVEDGVAGEGGLVNCSIKGQKQYVFAAMKDWYLWNDQLPNKVDLSQYSSPEELLGFLMTFSPDDGSGQPLDRFSFVTSAAADRLFFGQGKFGGFGLTWRFVAADDVRLTRVYAGSPADLAGLERGQQIVALGGRSISEIEANEGLSAALSVTPLEFSMREADGVTEFSVTIEHDLVTINPVPQAFLIERATGPAVGYLELSTFVATADAALESVFADFRAAGVNDVIIDLRYNGGGLVSTAELLADYFGGDIAENLIFSDTHFNADRAARNDRQALFARLANSLSLSRLVVIATGRTASASELVTNGMEPHVEVTIVGDDTFGKPVGQVGLEFCDRILRPTAFQTFNADGFGDYFDGLPVDCAADDDLNTAIGADDDPNMIAALTYLDTGACPVAAPATGQAKPDATWQPRREYRGGPPWREFAGAY